MNKVNLLFKFISIISLIAAIAISPAHAQEKESEKPSQILIKNVNIFDGKSEKLIQGKDVLVEGNLIKKVGKIDAPKDTLTFRLRSASWFSSLRACTSISKNAVGLVRSRLWTGMGS